ncbi:MAG: hypothetical protein IPI58_00060 [Alphaproteobacteria bacterium]|nr:MAG: hypothetical protein IPI58_00060 [Alphaproteobacteria bacterium]
MNDKAVFPPSAQEETPSPKKKIPDTSPVWDQMRDATAQAMRQGRVTKCPPAYAAGAYPDSITGDTP